ncbi:MAG TPA: RluA family pseudouridine synthase [Polyangiaceae bacterium]|nr:RluA family pseudouridine synthase [Polyangiaceae bacterium]
MSHEPGPGRALRDSSFVVAEGPPHALDRALRTANPGASWNDVRRLVRTGKVSVDGSVVVDPTALVHAGATVAIRMSAPRKGGATALAKTLIVHVDAHVVVVDKPPGIATVPYEDERDTLDRVVQSLLRKTARPGTSVAPLGVVQRLDKETSGLLVFARTTAAKRELQQQLRRHTMHRRYVALAHGAVRGGTIRSRLVQDRGDGRRGSTDRSDLGREAVTHVRVLERFERATLIECRLETGRTHQIRIHLSEAGNPLLGERVYSRGFADLLPAPRILLHAVELGFVHPTTGRELRFDRPIPDDMAAVIERERSRSGEIQEPGIPEDGPGRPPSRPNK